MVQVKIDREQIAAFCQKWQVAELSLFGSVLREDFRPTSDVDVLISFLPEARHTLFDMVHMQDELREIFGREVDLVERTAVEQSRNYIRRREILNSLEVIHAA